MPRIVESMAASLEFMGHRTNWTTIIVRLYARAYPCVQWGTNFLIKPVAMRHDDLVPPSMLSSTWNIIVAFVAADRAHTHHGTRAPAGMLASRRAFLSAVRWPCVPAAADANGPIPRWLHPVRA
jgi:hypothetical protein